MGYTQVYRYPAGFHGWKEAHPELVTGSVPEQRALAPGDAFPDCRLALLSGGDDRRYLELPEDARWLALSDLKAHFVLIQLYNTMCNECVSETKLLSLFLTLVEADPVLSGKLKILGLGVYDTNRAVVKFRKHYDVLYPLFADRHGEIFECLGQAEVPLAYLLRAKGDGTWVIELVKRGYFEPDEAFLDTLKQAIIRFEGID
jgi:peroxiredoxin